MTTSRFGRIDRRRLVTSSVVGGAALLTTGQPLRARTRTSQPATLLEQDGSSNVPMFRGDPARTGVMLGLGPDPANGIAAKWRFAAAGSITSSPAVVDGVVYVGSHACYAIDAVSGEERWNFVTDGGSFSSSPAVVDGVVYVGSELAFSGSENGNLYALDAASGEERWRFATKGLIPSSPAVVDGVVYVGSYNGSLYALGE